MSKTIEVFFDADYPMTMLMKIPSEWAEKPEEYGEKIRERIEDELNEMSKEELVEHFLHTAESGVSMRDYHLVGENGEMPCDF